MKKRRAETLKTKVHENKKIHKNKQQQLTGHITNNTNKTEVNKNMDNCSNQISNSFTLISKIACHVSKH